MSNFSSTYGSAITTRTSPAPSSTLISTLVTKTLRQSLIVVAHQGTAWDYPIAVPSKAISGTVYNTGGAVAAGVTVKLFRQADDALVATMTADGAGHYLFVRDANDILTYYVAAYDPPSSPQTHGLSDRGRVPA